MAQVNPHIRRPHEVPDTQICEEMLETLSERERQVMRLTACGHQSKGAARELGLSAGTVVTYKRLAMRKLDAPNAFAAVAIAVRGGIL